MCLFVIIEQLWWRGMLRPARHGCFTSARAAPQNALGNQILIQYTKERENKKYITSLFHLVNRLPRVAVML